ncbi:MAG TPA: peroxiredoxin [Porticoccaceae bacterium]|nr:peroxiredoxin [Porticoccaceae bacterium]
MPIQVGDTMPEGRFNLMKVDGPGSIGTKELFDGKKVVLFSVPGAFTPTCSRDHLPGFVEKADAIRAKGVDTVACMAVNDAFVMGAWGKQAGADDKVLMLADGNGDYTRALDLVLDGTGFGLGMRGKRFALIVDNGKVTQAFIEEAGQFKVSSAENVLAHL